MATCGLVMDCLELITGTAQVQAIHIDLGPGNPTWRLTSKPFSYDRSHNAKPSRPGRVLCHHEVYYAQLLSAVFAKLYNLNSHPVAMPSRWSTNKTTCTATSPREWPAMQVWFSKHMITNRFSAAACGPTWGYGQWWKEHPGHVTP